ncbi:MAG: hypothetical protein K2P93_08965 [Alphaproteobacteria bacterium]|nr:hypothetical protein [Alphaproteobacteria bacterium]
MSKSYLIVRHTVDDFSTWKAIYDGHLSSRERAGLKELHLLHHYEKPNDLTLIFEVEDIERAKAFIASFDTVNKMKEAHVIGEPEVYFLK